MMHKGQLDVSGATARSLLDEQFPQYRALPLRPLASAATVNSIFRLGEGLTVRFPLVGEDTDETRAVLRAEVAACAEFAALSPVPAPHPVAIGEPGHDYPLPWSIQTWVQGRDAVEVDPAGSDAFADDLANLLRVLREADTRGRRFTGVGRGGHLPDHDEWLGICFRNSEGLLDVVRLRRVWAFMRSLPEVDGDVMAHGDLTPPNVLVDRGGLAGVLDTGGFAAADPALDLVSVWHLLDERGRYRVRERLACPEVQWLRGAAWAFQQAMGLVWYYADTNPSMSQWGRRTLRRLLEAPELHDCD